MMRFPCPTCVQTISAPEDCAGRTSTCPWCKNPVTVPVPTSNEAISLKKPRQALKVNPEAVQSTRRERGGPLPLSQSPEKPAEQTQISAVGNPPSISDPRSFYRKAGLTLVLLVAFVVAGILRFGLYLVESTKNKPLRTAGTSSKEPKAARSEPRPIVVQNEKDFRNNGEKPALIKEEQKAVQARRPESQLPPENRNGQPSETQRWKLMKRMVEAIPQALDSLAAMYQSERGRASDNPSANASVAKGEGSDIEDTARKPIQIKRRSSLSDEDLRKQLMPAPEAGLNQTTVALLYAGLNPSSLRNAGSGNGLFGASLQIPTVRHDYGVQFLLELSKTQKHPENSILPWQFGPDCEMGKEAAENFHVLSNYLRACLRASVVSGDVRPDPEKLHSYLISGEKLGRAGFVPGSTAQIKPEEWRRPQAVPVLMQLLQHENTPIRLFLVELLSKIDGKEATILPRHEIRST